jgi:hypothetical protein
MRPTGRPYALSGAQTAVSKLAFVAVDLSQVAGQLVQEVVHGGLELADAGTCGAMRVAVPGDEVLQRDPVHAVVVLGGDPVDVGLPVLTEQDQWGGVGSLGGEDQVEQDERVRVPALGEGEQVGGDSGSHDHCLDDDKSPGSEHRGDVVGDPFSTPAPVHPAAVRRMSPRAGPRAGRGTIIAGHADSVDLGV